MLLVSNDVDPGYAVFCPSLPGCISEGTDWDSALAMIAEAIEGFLELGPRPVPPTGEKERTIREWSAIGCLVETATVSVKV